MHAVQDVHVSDVFISRVHNTTWSLPISSERIACDARTNVDCVCAAYEGESPLHMCEFCQTSNLAVRPNKSHPQFWFKQRFDDYQKK